MKRFYLIVIIGLLGAVSVNAQKTRVAQEHGTGAPAASRCTAGVEYVDDATGNLYTFKTGTGCVLSGNTAASSNPLTTLGDTLYGAAVGVETRLAGNTTSTKKFLTQTGDSVNSAAPGWNTIIAGDLPAAIDAAKIGGGGVSSTEYDFLGNVTSDIQTQITARELSANKDATGGYVGLTLFKINFKNAANTFTSFFTNTNSAARTYTFQNRDGTITDDTDLATKQNTITFGTGVQTALGVNVGSAGAPVLFNGNAGTPSALVGTNITGTASGLTAGTASAVAVGGITGLGTGVATALAVNVGTAGAFVVNGGALGSPSSAGTLPAFTLGGTVSGGGNDLNNTRIGNITPLAGSFTTITASGTFNGSTTGTGNSYSILAQNTTDSTFAQISSRGSTAAGTFLGTNKTGMVDIVFSPTTSGVAAIGTLNLTPLVLGTNDTAALTIGTNQGVTLAGTLTGINSSFTPTNTTGNGFAIAGSTTTTGNLVSIAASGTAAASNTKTALNVATSGANATNAQTTFGAIISNTSTNATSGTNIALQLTASGATTANTALNITAGITTLPNGTAAAPSLNLGDTTTGFFRSGGNIVSLSNAGTQSYDFSAADFRIRGTTPSIELGSSGSAPGFLTLADNQIQLKGTLFAFTGATSSFPALGRSTTRITVGLADGTAGGGVNFSTAAVISVASGTNQRAGNAVLVGGTVTVSNTTVTANTIVILTRKTSGGTIGTAVTYTLSAGTSFTITSDNILDTSTFSYILIEVP